MGDRRHFASIGRRFLTSFRRLGLTETDDVLDIGCGCGRMALPLAEYLVPSARYEGFDISAEAIEWCQDNITSQWPNFGFTHADMANTHYNPTGTVSADTFTFPYDDASFDFAFATSVLTHLLPSSVERYASEIARVLRPGGRLVATAFLWDDDTADRARRGTTQVAFPVERDRHRAASSDLEAVVAYDRTWLLDALRAVGLRPEVVPGSWRRRVTLDPAGFQDLISSAKSTAPV